MSMAFNMSLGLGVTIGFGALSLDLGYANFAATQAQAAADSAALAGAISLAAGDDRNIVSQAQSWGQRNKVGSSEIVVDDTDVRRGYLPDGADCRDFVTQAGGPDVYARAHTTATPGFFSRIWGVEDLNTGACAVARVLPGAVCTFIGMGSTTSNGGGSMVLMGYDSTIDFNPDNSPDDDAAMCSNADIKLNGNGTTVGGSVRPGIGKTIIGDTSEISGGTTPLTSALAYPELTPPSGLKNWPAAYSITNTVQLTPGSYRLNADLSITGGGSVRIKGNGVVKIYTDNHAIRIDGNGLVNTSKNPHNFSIYGRGAGSDIAIGGNFDFYGYVYTPSATVTLSGNAGFYGAIVGDELVLNGGARQDIYMDTSLMDNEQAGGIQLRR
jgi:hypothetical protein